MTAKIGENINYQKRLNLDCNNEISLNYKLGRLGVGCWVLNIIVHDDVPVN